MNIIKAFQENPLFAVPGKLILLIILSISLILTFSLIMLPLFISNRQGFSGREGLPYLFYFFGIGVSFMLLEIYFMQKFTLLLGHPVYSLSLVLFSLLVFSGTGSLMSKKVIQNSRRRLGIAIGLLASLILLFIAFLPSIFSLFLGTPLLVRIFLTLVILFPLSFLMGLPFPSGISLAAKSNSHMIPWLWGINSFASVISSSLCILVALEFGFAIVAILASLGYIAAYFGLSFSES